MNWALSVSRSVPPFFRNTRRCAGVLAALLFEVPLSAQYTVTVKYVGYTDNNQVTVNTGALDLAAALPAGVHLTLGTVLDGISAASRALQLVDGISAATTRVRQEQTEVRRDWSVGVSRRFGETTLGVLFDDSLEDDYASQSWSCSVLHEMNQRNTGLNLVITRYDDRVFPYGVPWQDTRNAVITDIALTQVLTPTAQARLSLSYTREDGFLDNPYHRVGIVLADGTTYYFAEQHPTGRDRAACSILYVHGFPEAGPSSVHLDYRAYTDNWRITSHTFGAQYHRRFTDAVSAYLRTRYYTQTGAFFFRNAYREEERFMTADTKLAPLSSLLYGIGMTWSVLPWCTVDLSFEDYRQCTSLDYTPLYTSIAKRDLEARMLYLGTTFNF
jgi:hypothetical protein